MMYQVRKNNETIALFYSENEAKQFAVDKQSGITNEWLNYEEENELCFDELPDYEILDEANIEVEETNADKELLLNIWGWKEKCQFLMIWKKHWR